MLLTGNYFPFHLKALNSSTTTSGTRASPATVSHWSRPIDEKLNASANEGTSSTASENTRDAPMAKIRGLFSSGLNLNLDSVLEWRFPACTSLAAISEANAIV